jgi:hypothetical protein
VTLADFCKLSNKRYLTKCRIRKRCRVKCHPFIKVILAFKAITPNIIKIKEGVFQRDHYSENYRMSETFSNICKKES